MKLKFYINHDSNNTINKNLESLKEININFKTIQDTFLPSLVLTRKNVPVQSNYLELNNKYYFIEKVNLFHTDYVILKLKEDVLYTFKDDILNSDVDIIEKSKPSNYNQNSTTNEVIKDKYTSDTTIKLNDHIIVQTVGNPLREV